MTESKIEQFAKDFKFITGMDLERRLPDNDFDTNKVASFVNRCEMLVEEEIKARNPNYAIWKARGLSEPQLDAIYRATIEQAIYMFSVGDFNLMSGYDPITGVMTPLEELRKRAFSPMAKKVLTNAGLFYAGIGYSTNVGPDRTGWR